MLSQELATMKPANRIKREVKIQWRVHALSMIDWNNSKGSWIEFVYPISFKTRLIPSGHLIANRRKKSRLFEVFRKQDFPERVFADSIMVKCLLFTFPKMNSAQGWNIWWSTWPNKLCNYPLEVSLFSARKPILSFIPSMQISGCQLRNEAWRKNSGYYPEIKREY